MILTALPAMSAPQGTGENVLTNYEVIEDISEKAIEELKANMPQLENDASIVLIKSKGAGSIDDVFMNVLVRNLTQSGFKVSTKYPEDSSQILENTYEMNLQLVRLSLKYAEISRSYWVGSKTVDRLAEIGIFSQLIRYKTGDIIWVGETQKKYEDTISYSLLERVEDPQHDFTRPTRKELRWSKLVEPVIVTGIVTGLVYLFFSNQSSSD